MDPIFSFPPLFWRQVELDLSFWLVKSPEITERDSQQALGYPLASSMVGAKIALRRQIPLFLEAR